MLTRKLASSVFVTLLSIILLGASSDAQFETPTPTPTSTGESSAIPTVTPEPGATAVPTLAETLTPGDTVVPTVTPISTPTPEPTSVATFMPSPALCSAELGAFANDFAAAVDHAEATLMAVTGPLGDAMEPPFEDPGMYGDAASDIEFLVMLEVELLEDSLNPIANETPTPYPAYGPGDAEGNSMLFALPPPNPRQKWRMQRVSELTEVINRHKLKIESLVRRRAAVAAALGAPDTTAEAVRLAQLEAWNSSLAFDLAAMSSYLATIDNPVSNIYEWVWDPICGGAISAHIARARVAVTSIADRIAQNKKEIEKLKKTIAGRPQELIDIDAMIAESTRIIAQSEELRRKFQQGP